MTHADISSEARGRALRTTAAHGVDAAAPGRRGGPASDHLTERSFRIWNAGDYDRIAAGFRDGAEAFVERRRLQPGQRVLDAACGSGNVTIPAARTGATVTGVDLVRSLLADARAWADREGLSLTLDEGSAEELPYADGQFDVVLSMFGVMFAARPDRVVAELARVTRRGGQVALANWTRHGFIGRLLAMHAAVAPPPAEVPSPLLWADEGALRKLFDGRTWQLTTTARTLTFRYPHTPAGTAELFRAAYGPTVRAFEVLDEDRRVAFAFDLADHWSRSQRASGTTTEVEAEYLEVVAVRR
jgi:ubiquinone/menaquinone biosynthesis C-methylase UbiE